ncbi:MAG: putative toxin-antitoxin system toxin component, PIN family [Burkholderiales bacterium]
MRAVIDTNILVSALLTPSGVSSQVIAAMRSQALVPVISQNILEEYMEVLFRPRFGFKRDEIVSLLMDMKGLALFLNPQSIPPQGLPDPDDAPFIATALTAGCVIITGNKKHFPPEIGVKIFSPAEVLLRLQSL